MKRAPHKKSIVVPFIVSIIVTVMILLGAEYVFHIPSKFFMTPVAETVIPEKTSWSKTSFTDYSGSENSGSILFDSGMMIPLGEETLTGVSDLDGSGSIGTGSEFVPVTPIQPETPRVNDDVACTLEYSPVCGADGRTYSNPCMANRAKTIVAYEGSCTTSGAPAVTPVADTLEVADSEIVFDTGSYVPYSNASYSFYLPKYAYYSGYGAQGGAAHTLAIGLTPTGTDSFDTADIRVSFYRTEPANPPEGKKINVTNGVIYVDGNMSDAKVAKIIDTIGASAK